MEKRGVQPPRGTMTATGEFIAHHAEWLAAGAGEPDPRYAPRYARDASTEMREVVRRAWSVAYPSGVKTVPVKLPNGATVKCPESGCDGTVTARVDGKACEADKDTSFEIPGELVCNANPDEHWWEA